MPSSSILESHRQLNLITRSMNVLYTAQIKTVEELCMFTREELLSVRNSGKKTVKDVEDALGCNGFAIGGVGQHFK